MYKYLRDHYGPGCNKFCSVRPIPFLSLPLLGLRREVRVTSAAGWQWLWIRSGISLCGSPPPMRAVLEPSPLALALAWPVLQGYLWHDPLWWSLPSWLALRHLLDSHPVAALVGPALLSLIRAAGLYSTSGLCSTPCKVHKWVCPCDRVKEGDTEMLLIALHFTCTEQTWATGRNCGNFCQQLLGKGENHLFLLSLQKPMGKWLNSHKWKNHEWKSSKLPKFLFWILLQAFCSIKEQ